MFLIIICIQIVSFVRPREAHGPGHLQNIVKLCNRCPAIPHEGTNERIEQLTLSNNLPPFIHLQNEVL